jgi:hypothetical protein
LLNPIVQNHHDLPDDAIDDTHRVVDQGGEERGSDWYQQAWKALL